jgi:undecaprenyl diphosphate synthase
MSTTVPIRDEPAVYTTEELSLLDLSNIPSHVAMIMDGNRRWADQQQVPRAIGHWEGAETLTEVVRAASEIGIKTVTVFAFSTENWIRSEEEVADLMRLFEVYLHKKREEMVKEGIALSAIGDLDKLPPPVRTAYEETRRATAQGAKIQLVLALNYGGRDEIRRAISKLVRQPHFDPDALTEEQIGACLDTARFGDPELLIRTSGEMRLSNFLLWQLSYAEIYITDTLWPQFSPKDLLEAVLHYQKRKRRKGGA